MLFLQLSDPPLPFPASHQGFPVPGHPSDPSLRPRKGQLRRQGLGRREECPLPTGQGEEPKCAGSFQLLQAPGTRSLGDGGGSLRVPEAL